MVPSEPLREKVTHKGCAAILRLGVCVIKRNNANFAICGRWWRGKSDYGVFPGKLGGASHREKFCGALGGVRGVDVPEIDTAKDYLLKEGAGQKGGKLLKKVAGN